MASTVQSKHFLNTPASLVLDSLEGVCAVNSQVALDVVNKVVYVKNHDQNKVALMCGGGSGHEPAHASFVGQGMLTGAVCGNIFASPSASQVRRGINLIDNNKGTVIIVKNYTGDVLNFGLAKEDYAASRPDKADRVKFVIVGDDVAVGRTQGNIVGRRGLAGTVLVYKIAGALANNGGSLEDVYNMAEFIAKNIVTVGVSLGHTHVPGTAPLTIDLAATEVEIGLGIHNESGHKRVSPIPPLSELLPQLLDLLTSTSDPERSFVPFKGKDNVVLLVNNLGALSELELGAITAAARKALDAKGFTTSRVLAGSFMTSLNMPGFSITLLLLPSPDDTTAPSASKILALLDERPLVPGWRWSSNSLPQPTREQIITVVEEGTDKAPPYQLKALDAQQFNSGVERAAKALIANEPEITKMDTIAGDGDCGLTLKAGAEGVLSSINNGSINGNNVMTAMMEVSRIAEEAMGGTSGALYSIFFSGLAQGLQAQAKNSDVITAQIWSDALVAAKDKLYTYTRARPPSRTLVDPLVAFIEALVGNPEKNFAGAVMAAADAAEATKNMEAKAGRSAYVEGSRLKDEQIPDPGAWGIKTILENLTA